MAHFTRTSQLKSTDTGSRMVVPGAGGGGNGRCLVGTESQVSKMKRVLEMMVVMVVNVLNAAELHSKLVKMAHVTLQTFHHNFLKKGLLRLRDLRTASLSQELFNKRLWIFAKKTNKPKKPVEYTLSRKCMTLLTTEMDFQPNIPLGRPGAVWGEGPASSGSPALPSFPRSCSQKMNDTPREQGLCPPAHHPPSEGRPSSEICRYNSFDLAFSSLWKGKRAVNPSKCFIRFWNSIIVCL